jgi:membrane protease subunit HflK
MAWNEPGKDKQPGSDNQGPPDLDKMLRNFFGKLGKGGGQGTPTSPNGGIGITSILLIASIILAVWGLMGIYIVGPAEQAAVLRFGKYVKTVGPGPHWIPRLISSQETLNVKQINELEYSEEMLTKDRNLVNVKLTVQYRIGDPRDYLFNIINPSNSLRLATASAVRQVVGRSNFKNVLATERDDVRDEILTTLQKTIENYAAGISIVNVTLQLVTPPEGRVAEAFDDAISARADALRYVDEAEAYRAKIKPLAEGEAARILALAEADKNKIILESQATVAPYEALLGEYTKAPKVTRERLYLDTIQSVLENSSKVLVDTKSNNLLYLPLDKLMQSSSASDKLAADNHDGNSNVPLITRNQRSSDFNDLVMPKNRQTTRTTRRETRS